MSNHVYACLRGSIVRRLALRFFFNMATFFSTWRLHYKFAWSNSGESNGCTWSNYLFRDVFVYVWYPALPDAVPLIRLLSINGAASGRHALVVMPFTDTRSHVRVPPCLDPRSSSSSLGVATLLFVLQHHVIRIERRVSSIPVGSPIMTIIVLGLEKVCLDRGPIWRDSTSLCRHPTGHIRDSYDRSLGYDQWEGGFSDMLSILRFGYEGTLRHETIRKQVLLKKTLEGSCFGKRKSHKIGTVFLDLFFPHGNPLTMTRQSYGASGVGNHVGSAHGWSVFTHFPTHIGGP